jgi:hypothetical protein
MLKHAGVAAHGSPDPTAATDSWEEIIARLDQLPQQLVQGSAALRIIDRHALERGCDRRLSCEDVDVLRGLLDALHVVRMWENVSQVIAARKSMFHRRF